MFMNRFVKCLFISVAILLVTSTANADNFARDYIPLPPDTKAIAIYGFRTAGYKLYSDSSKVSTDFNFSGSTGLIRSIYYTQLGPFVINPQVLLPFGDIRYEAGGTEASSVGIGDPFIASGFWLINKPEDQLWFCVMPYIFFPLGEYDKANTINLGANRYTYRFETNITHGFGPYYIEATANAEWYGNNNDFGIENATLGQDPLYTLESHFSYSFTDSFFTALDYYYHNGGETKISGIKQDNEKDDHIIGWSFGWMLKNDVQLFFQYRQDIEINNGSKTNMIGLRFFHFF